MLDKIVGHNPMPPGYEHPFDFDSNPMLKVDECIRPEAKVKEHIDESLPKVTLLGFSSKNRPFGNALHHGLSKPLGLALLVLGDAFGLDALDVGEAVSAVGTCGPDGRQLARFVPFPERVLAKAEHPAGFADTDELINVCFHALMIQCMEYVSL
jgi:hypothetical protein